jgi:hypothetical protein
MLETIASHLLNFFLQNINALLLRPEDLKARDVLILEVTVNIHASIITS